MGALIWPLLGVLAGAFVAVQAPVNAALARGLGMPVAAAAISFLVGAIALGLITTILTQSQSAPVNWRGPAPWMFILGGLLGAAFVTCNIILVPKLGAAALMAALIAGQLVTGLILDRIGFLGLAVREITLGRLTGALLLLSGALLIRFT